MATGRELEHVEAGVAARRGDLDGPPRGFAPGRHRLRAADAAQAPAVRAAARIDVDAQLLAGGDGPQRRLGGDRADRQAGPPARRAPRWHFARRGPEVRGAVAGGDLHHVDPGRRRRALDAAVPHERARVLDRSELRDHARLAVVGPPDAAALGQAARDRSDLDLHRHRRGPDDRPGLDPLHARARRPRVDQRGARHDDRPALATERDAHAVAAVGHAFAVVGPAVPLQLQRPAAGPPWRSR